VCTTGDNESAFNNFKQYSLESKFVDMVVADASHHPWKERELFDAIVTDRKCKYMAVMLAIELVLPYRVVCTFIYKH